MGKINSSGFVESKSIIVYPCAYRESSVDLKSKLNLEENIIRTALYGSTGNRTYIVSKTDTELVCFIKGYYFEITVEKNEFDSYAGIVINTGKINDDYVATVLTPFDGNTTDTIDQRDTTNTTYYFKALKFVKTDSTETPDLYFDESKNTKPVSYTDVGSVKLDSTITGNLISGAEKGSIVQIKDNTVTNTASAENAIALGEGTTAKWKNELAIGKYNADTEDGNLFVIGGGDETTKKNILTIRATATANYACFTGATVELDSISSLSNKGSTNLSAPLIVDGTATFNDTLTANGTATFNNTLTAEKAATFNDTLTANGEATFNNTLTANGAATFKDTLTANGTATFNNTLTAEKAATFKDTLTAEKAATFNDTLTAEKAATFNDTLTCNQQIKATSFYATSDKRLKENIVDYVPENSILDLPIKEFDFKSDGSHHIGCIAQDLQKICPELVQEGEDGYLSIEESKLVYLLLNEVKLLKAEVEELKEKLK